MIACESQIIIIKLNCFIVWKSFRMKIFINSKFSTLPITNKNEEEWICAGSWGKIAGKDEKMSRWKGRVSMKKKSFVCKYCEFEQGMRIKIDKKREKKGKRKSGWYWFVGLREYILFLKYEHVIHTHNKRKFSFPQPFFRLPSRDWTFLQTFYTTNMRNNLQFHSTSSFVLSLLSIISFLISSGDILITASIFFLTIVGNLIFVLLQLFLI